MPLAPSLLTIQEAAGYLGVSPHTLYKLVQRRKVPAAKVGGSWRLSKEVLDRFISSQAEVRSPRVLIIEPDDLESDRLSGIAMRRAGAVITCASYEEALAQVQQFAPDIVIASIGSDGHGAGGFFQECRRRDVPVRMAVLVEPSNTAAVGELLGQGPVLVLCKPVEREDILAVLSLISR